MKTFHSEMGLDLDWLWLRIEYQQRGTVYVHGCNHLKLDLGIYELSQKVLEGRITQQKLKLLNLLDENDFCVHEELVKDNFLWEEELLKLKQSKFLQLLSEDEINTNRKLVEEGRLAYRKVIAFHD